MEGIREGFSIYKNSIVFIIKHPFTLLPMLLVFGVNVYTVLFVNQNVNFEGMEWHQTLWILYLTTLIMTFTLGLASLFVLELLEQHERFGKMNPFLALKDMLLKDLWRALPIILGWSVVDFVLSILIAVLARSRKNDSGHTTRPPGPFETTLRILQTTVRMGTMVVFTVVAWEDKTTSESFSKGIDVYKHSLETLLTGVGISEITTILLFIPVLLFVFIANALSIPVDVFMIVLLIYIPFTWAVGKLIEQLYVSETYLWYLHYEKAKLKAKEQGTEGPKHIYDIKAPSFTDYNLDL